MVSENLGDLMKSTIGLQVQPSSSTANLNIQRRHFVHYDLSAYYWARGPGKQVFSDLHC